MHHHACGLPLLIEDAHGRTVWFASRFDPYGTIEVHPSSTIDFAPRWPGHRLDADTGLFYNRFRDFDPALGRYLQPDPLGLGGGPNLYAYATNPQAAQMDEARTLSEHLPPDKRQVVLDSMAEIQRREREFAQPATLAQATEMRGEADATLHMLRESRDPNSPFHGMEPATRYGAGSGMDQVWVRRDADGNITEALVVEAKGRNGTSGRPAGLSPGNLETGLPAQMSTGWIESRARAIDRDSSASPTECAAARAILDGLNDGPPPVVEGRLITGGFRADEAPATSSRRRRTDANSTMAVPKRPTGAPSDSEYPTDGRHN